MKADRLPRRLAAILYADVAGYSRLTGQDEDATHHMLSEYLDLIAAAVERSNGRVMHYAGDAVLAMFDAAVDAVSCAMLIQTQLAERNASLQDGQKVEFRIGVNLGDVIEDRGDIYGDGVNVAARLESIAEPGGVCISEAVRFSLGTKLEFHYEFLGEQRVKNIAEAVRAYRVIRLSDVAPARVSVLKLPTRTRIAFLVLFITLVAVALALLSTRDPHEETTLADSPTTPRSDTPSIAVLPFENLSNDSEQEYFVDGMTDDLITDLSKLSGLTVIARNSVFSFKGMPRDLKKISNDLGVQYVLEGSVRRAGGMIRINAQLIDTTTAEHVWAERYDAEGTDIFAMQDKVVRNIVAALEVNLSDNEEIQLARIPTKNIEAYDFYLRGRRGLWVGTAQGRREALMNFQKAIELDRQFADAYAGVARVASMVWRMNDATVLPSPIARKLAYQASGKALSMDPLNAQAYSVLAHLQLADGNHEEAVRSVKKAISLQPGTAEIYTDLTEILVYAGRPEEALAAIETAFRLEPDPPPNFYFNQGSALFSDRRYQEAIEPLEKAFEEGVQKFEPLAKTYAQLGQLEKAKFMVDKLFEVFPGASLVEYRANESKLYRRQEDLDHSIDSLRKAGVPEWPFGYAAQPEDRLVGTAISELVLGQVWTGNDIVNGGPFIQETSEDGKTAFRSGYSLVTGKAWVENDQLCLHFPTYGEHHKICSYVFRNTDSAPGQQNDYVLVGEKQVLHFSATPLDRAVGN